MSKSASGEHDIEVRQPAAAGKSMRTEDMRTDPMSLSGLLEAENVVDQPSVVAQRLKEQEFSTLGDILDLELEHNVLLDLLLRCNVKSLSAHKLAKWLVEQRLFYRKDSKQTSQIEQPYEARQIEKDQKTGKFIPRLDVYAMLENLVEVDIIKQRFRAAVFVEIRIPGTEDYNKHKGFKIGGFDHIDNGRLFKLIKQIGDYMHFDNEAGPLDYSENRVVGWTHDKLNMMNIRISAAGHFSQKMDLYNFPVDRQALTVKLRNGSSLSGSRPFKFGILTQTADGKELKSTVDTSNFHLDNVYELSGDLLLKPYEIDPTKSGKDKKYPVIEITAHVTRKSRYYLWNVCVPMCVFSLMSFSTFCLPQEDLSDRLVTVLTITLTITAFKLVVSEMLPTVNYATLLDQYILSSGAFVALLMLTVVISHYHAPVETALVSTILSLYFLVQVYFVWRAFSVAKERNNETFKFTEEIAKEKRKSFNDDPGRLADANGSRI